ncbi:MAG: biotin/lipoyl-binding protein, partial [Paracoccaceae bacterium]
MSVIKQLLLALVLLFVGLVGAAVLVPAARPFADRIGLSAPLERLGLISPVAEADAALPQGGGKAAGATAVVATEPVPEQMNDEVVSVGSARAIRSVSVSSEVTGRLRTLHIASGDFVQAGAPLAELDD